jgi:hypothetical protein
MSKKNLNKPKILVLDIETAPILGYVWSLWENNLALNQVEQDWFILSWSAKWFQNSKTGEVFGPHNKVMYQDQRRVRNVENDKKLLKDIHALINEADIILTQNGKSFDRKKLNARFILNGMSPPSPARDIDTKLIASKYFSFTSNKLEYMTEKLNKKYKKMKNSGFSLWTRCLKGDLDAWKEMQEYNTYDILSLEELYNTFAPWDNSINFSVYDENEESKCKCGSTSLHRRGFNFTNTGKFQRFQCRDCGTWLASKTNLLTKEKRKSLLK